MAKAPPTRPRSRRSSPDGGFFDKGVSLHVCAVDPAHEFLRFDVFDDDPHYHYVDTSGTANRVVAFDEVAHGDMLPWALDRLRSHLPAMLTRGRRRAGRGVGAGDAGNGARRAGRPVADLAAEARRAQAGR